MSSSGMPLTTFEPEERRDEDGVVGLDLGRARGQVESRSTGSRRRRRRGARRHLRLRWDAAPVGVVVAVAALDLAEAVHHAQALEGVLAVEQPAVVDLAQVALDVGAGERGAAEQHRDVRQARGR